MTDYRNVLERDLARVGPAPFDFDDVARRRDRKRRNQRIAAGVVGIAVFVAAIWVVTSVGSLDRRETSVVPGGDVTGPAETGPAETGPAETGPMETGPTETGPTETGPTETGPAFVPPDAPDEWDGSTLPPEGTALSTPVEGQPIRRSRDYRHYLIVYADGRVLWWNALRSPGVDGPGGGDYVLERRLTPEGVDLVRSGVITAWDLVPPQGLNVPASAWADAVARPYAPPRYSLCLWQNDQLPVPSAVDMLPPPAEALLRGNDPDPLHPGCLVVSTEEARALYGIAQEAGFNAAPDLGGVTPGATVGAWLLRGPEGALGEQVAVYLRPLWPDGEWHELYLA